MNIFEPRERFPSGSRVDVRFPPDGRDISIDGACLKEANAIIGRYKAGEMTESEARQALYDLEFGLPKD